MPTTAWRFCSEGFETWWSSVNNGLHAFFSTYRLITWENVPLPLSTLTCAPRKGRQNIVLVCKSSSRVSFRRLRRRYQSISCYILPKQWNEQRIKIYSESGFTHYIYKSVRDSKESLGDFKFERCGCILSLFRIFVFLWFHLHWRGGCTHWPPAIRQGGLHF